MWKSHLIQSPFMIKTHSDPEIERNLINLKKTIYEKPRATITLNGERLIAVPYEQEEDTDGCSCHFYLSLHQTFQVEKLGELLEWKGKSKISLSVDDIIFYREHPKEST